MSASSANESLSLATTEATTSVAQGTEANLADPLGSNGHEEATTQDLMIMDTNEPTTLSEKQLKKRLRQYEINAYGSIVSAFRAQGEMTWEKMKVLSQLQQMLHVSTKRHSSELLRAEVDGRIQQVAQSGVYNIIEREAEENQTDFDFSLVMSETESENETDHLHHHVKHLAETPQKSTRKRGGHTGRGRGRGRKRSSTTMIAESLTHSPAKPSLVTNTNDQVITSASDATSQVAALNVSTDIQSTSGTLPPTAPNGTPVKKKRGSQPSEEINQILSETTFLSDEDINNVNNLEEIESIAERESQQIGELEKKLSEGLDSFDTQAIVDAIKKKKDTLEKLIQKLESAEE